MHFKPLQTICRVGECFEFGQATFHLNSEDSADTHALGVRSLMVLVLGPRTLTKVKTEYCFLLPKFLVLSHLTTGLESVSENSIFFMERQKETCVACLDSVPRRCLEQA